MHRYLKSVQQRICRGDKIEIFKEKWTFQNWKWNQRRSEQLSILLELRCKEIRNQHIIEYTVSLNIEHLLFVQEVYFVVTEYRINRGRNNYQCSFESLCIEIQNQCSIEYAAEPNGIRILINSHHILFLKEIKIFLLRLTKICQIVVNPMNLAIALKTF